MVKDAGLLAARLKSLPLSSDPEEDQRLHAETIHAAETFWRGGQVCSVRVVVGNLLSMLGVPEPASPEPSQGTEDKINEECTDVRCRRIDGRCVGMHCAKCGGPCGPQGHIGGCPPSQGNGDTETERFHVSQRVEYAGEEGFLVGTIARISDRHEEALVYDDETHWSRWVSFGDLRPATEAKGQDTEGNHG